MKSTKKNCEKENSWIKHYWRPAMAYQYLAVCLSDFIFFPILTMLYYGYVGGEYIPWDPITLKESGFYHLAMGAILGVSAWTRGQEKIKNIYSGDVVETSHMSQTPYYRNQSSQEPEYNEHGLHADEVPPSSRHNREDRDIG